MDRALRLGSLWNWLPVFRAVAEMEHLHKAAKALHVSPSAVSRTIRLLEEDVGHQLFTRSGNTVRLNARGQALLGSVRDAMRLLDDGVGAISEAKAVGAVRIACAGDHPLGFLWRATREVSARYPGLVAQVSRPPFEQISALLLRGELDVAFGYRAERSEHLKVATLGVVTHGIFCGVGHPLFRVKAPTLEEVLTYPFAAPSLDESQGATDFWPEEIVRKVSIHLPALTPAIEMCAHGHVLAVLPDRLPRSAGKLRRLPLDVIAPVKFFAVYRRPFTPDDVAEAIANAMASQMCPPAKRREAKG